MSFVLAFNCSPRMGRGNTALILDPFIEGLRDAGARVELLYTKKLRILPCTGEFSCWSARTRGKCHLKDDCAAVLERMGKADAWVFGVPVYAKLPGELQNLFNRTMPLLEPPPIVRGKSIVPSVRKGLRLKRMGLISTCSYWGTENFDLLVDQVAFMAKVFGVPLARPVLRPQADLIMEGRRDGSGIFEQARRAGREFAKKGDVSREAASAIQRPFMTRAEFLSGE